MDSNHEPVWCEDCLNRIARLDAKDLPAYRWLCMAAPRVPGPNFVSRRLTVEEPYYRCSVVNHNGDCRRFEMSPLAKAMPHV